MASKSRVTILVKAAPQPSKKHQETVCCAGLDPSGNWKRLFPVRFRQLRNDQSFKRWSVVDFTYSKPTNDIRKESCKVHEESIVVVDQVGNAVKKSNLIEPVIVSSEIEAADRSDSLAVIRPNEVELKWKARSRAKIEEARAAFDAQARQASMFDKELDTIEPCPFDIKLAFTDGDGRRREKACADWETQAAFFSLRRKYGEVGALEHLQRTYCEQYVQSGMVLALGNMAARPQTWQLLGIIPIAETKQASLL